jgi:8-oxo-dGTP pyrophosphatase MutT (NUDIX family)
MAMGPADNVPVSICPVPGGSVRAVWPGAGQSPPGATTRDAATTTLVDRAWAEMCAANPRLHDGPIFAVTDASTPQSLVVALGGYRDLAVQGHRLADGNVVPDPGVRMLGIKAIITARGTDGQDHALILRRGPEVRMYPGMWEIGPAGAVDVPASANASPRPGEMAIDWNGLLATLCREAEEELGIDLAAMAEPAPGGGVGIARWVCDDRTARSIDIIVQVRWRAAVDPKAGWCQLGREGWEYTDAAWLARRDAASWASRASQVSDISRVVLRTWAEDKSDDRA